MNKSNIKWCNGCKQNLPINAFGICRKSRSGLNYKCKKCINEMTTNLRRKYGISPNPNLIAPSGTKWCKPCEKYLPLDDFYLSKSGGRYHYCKACCRKNEKENRDYYKRYGISKQNVIEIWDKQNRRCATCYKSIIFGSDKRNAIHVDHCHKSKIIRGLLCHNCNVSLGLCEDNALTLKSLTIYLYNGISYKDKIPLAHKDYKISKSLSTKCNNTNIYINKKDLTKKCPECQIIKPFDDYGSRKYRRSIGVEFACKDCMRWIRREKKYQISKDFLAKMLAWQNRQCAGCKKTISFYSKSKNDVATVDHCHLTSMVRGLLCNNCNSLLGHCKDDLFLLTRLADYLEEYN